MDHSITVEIDGKATDVKMSFGLLLALAKDTGDGDIGAIYSNAEVMEKLAKTALQPRDATGRIKGDGPALGNLSVEDGEKLVAWIGEHLVDFFVRQLARAATSGEILKKAVDKAKGSSTSSSSGTAA